MSKVIDRIIAEVIQAEGGYVNDPADRGIGYQDLFVEPRLIAVSRCTACVSRHQ